MDDAIAALAQANVRIFIGPRPGKKSLNALRDLNLTHCCTLLSEREGARSIEAISRRLACQWVWLPIEGGRIDVLQRTDLAAHFATLARAIADTNEPRLYFHCSAGIHRTGFFAYLVLRLRGLDRNAALAELAAIRPVTAEQVGDERIELAEECLSELTA